MFDVFTCPHGVQDPRSFRPTTPEAFSNSSLQTQQAQQADLAIGLDNTYLQTALNFCLLQPHNANVSDISTSALEPYNGPMALPFDRGDVCLNYDETRVDGTNLTVPTSLWNLTEPEWKGLTAFPSPVTSSPGRAFMSATVDYFEHDEDNTTDAFDWWKAMADNGAIFTTGWTKPTKSTTAAATASGWKVISVMRP